MSESTFPMEEGGIVAHISVDLPTMQLETKPEVWDPCPICGEQVMVNGHCKYCICGWSSCSI